MNHKLVLNQCMSNGFLRSGVLYIYFWFYLVWVDLSFLTSLVVVEKVDPSHLFQSLEPFERLLLNVYFIVKKLRRNNLHLLCQLLNYCVLFCLPRWRNCILLCFFYSFSVNSYSSGHLKHRVRNWSFIGYPPYWILTEIAFLHWGSFFSSIIYYLYK